MKYSNFCERNEHSEDSNDPIPNRIHAKPVRKIGTIVLAGVVGLFSVAVIYFLVTNPNFAWPTVWKYLFNEHILTGVVWTLNLTVLSMVIAIALAIALAIMRQSANVVLRAVSWFFIWFFRGTPVYTQLVFWGLISVLIPKITIGVWSWDTQDVITAGKAAVLGLALNEAAYAAEIVRAGLEAVDYGQVEAAQALGMKKTLIMRRIVLPQAMRIIVPPMSNEAISMLKTTSLVIAVPFTMELQYMSNNIANRIYQPIPLLIVAGLWYLFITSVLMVGQHYLEKYFGKGDSQRPIKNKANTQSHFAPHELYETVGQASSDTINKGSDLVSLDDPEDNLQIVVKNVHKEYGHVHVLKGINLDATNFPAGRICCTS